MSLNPLNPDFQKAIKQAANVKFKRVQSYLAKAGEARDIPHTPRANGSRDPRLIGELLDDFSTLNEFSAPLAVANLSVSWEAIVGNEIADHVSILDFDDATGRLRLVADSTAWATQIRMLTNVIQDRIADEIGPEIVKIVEVLGPRAPSWKHGVRSVKGRGPRDTYG